MSRPLLTRRLGEGFETGRQLTLVSAPAGFGKTTCINAWLDEMAAPVAWLSLDAADDDPARFFAYLLAALQRIDATIGREIEGVLRAGQLPPADIISATLINGILGVDERFLLVLDDFQVLQDAIILGVLQTVVANLPGPLHLVLLTREEPSLPLARLRANNQMTEIRASDLHFAGQETTTFLNETMGLSLDTADIAALEEKTEGWIAGLQLAGLSLREHPNPSAFIAGLSGSHRHILSYLMEEVLNQQPQEIQRFLLQTAILDKLNGDLCDAVTGARDSRVLLERLFNDNLFLTPLDDERQWYRYHQLFADLLRDRQQTLHPEHTAELHRRASRWYALAGLSSEAIQHAIDGEDYETAIALIETHYMDRLLAWHARIVKNWMQSVPAELAAKSPKTNLAFAWMHLMSNDFAQALPYIERLRVMFSESGIGEDDPAVRAEWLAMQAMLLNAQGQPEQSLVLGNEALAIVPQEDAYVRSLIYSGLATAYIQKNDAPRVVEAYRQLIEHGRMAGSLLPELMGVAGLGLYLIERGELQFAFDVASRGIESVKRSGTLPPITGAIYGELASIYYFWNQIEEALAYFERSAQVSKLSGYSDAEVFYHVILSRLAQIEGDIETAAREMALAVELTEIEAPTAVREEVIAQRVRISLAQNQLAVVETLLKPHGFIFQPDLSLPPLSPEQVLDSSTALLYTSALRTILYLAQAREQAAELKQGISLSGQLIKAAHKSHLLRTVMETLLIRAQMQAALGDEQAARADVVATLELGEAEGFITGFLEEGQPVAAILAQLLGDNQLQGVQAAYARKILAAYPEWRQPQWRQPPVAIVPEVASPEQPAIESLSKRELEILRLIGDGCTNQEIAERLMITLHTVKKHSSNIYAKLGVHSRTQALARARELRLL